MRERNTKKNHIWLWWLVAFLTILILGFFTYTTSREMSKKKKIEKEINILKDQAEKIEKENIELQERIAYFSSSDYQKMQAKDKLNLQSPDENVVVVSSGPVKKEEQKNSTQNVTALAQQDIPNFQKWLNLFFK